MSSDVAMSAAPPAEEDPSNKRAAPDEETPATQEDIQDPYAVPVAAPEEKRVNTGTPPNSAGPIDAVQALSALGYCYRAPEGSNDIRDERLTKLDGSGGFEWRGQEDYDKVAEACAAYCKSRLVVSSGLMEVAIGEAKIWASPKDAGLNAPLCFLVCGSYPGGSAGVWGRSLCVNGTLREGGMFDYVRRARELLGCNVVVADPNVSQEAGSLVPGSECPHLHLASLYGCAVDPEGTRDVVIVAHSYGASAVAYLFKVKPECRARVKAVAFTDGCALSGSILCERPPPPGSAGPGVQRLRLVEERAPEAFQEDPEAAAALTAVARNFVASPEPLGAPVSRPPFDSVSAGHTKHPATTHAATDAVFAFLREKLAKSGLDSAE